MPVGDAGARTNVVFGPFIDRQCFLPSGTGVSPVRKVDSQSRRGRRSGIESIMHSGLDQSGSPQLLSGEVRQEDWPIRTGGTPVPPLESPDEDQIMEAIAAGDRSPLEIARRAGMSILELARVVTTPRSLEALGRVAQLNAIQREMLLGKLKRDALIRLGELTAEVAASSGDEVRACEVMRKACVDLLRYGGVNTEKRPSGNGEPGGPGSRGYHREPITLATEAEVLEALERWGHEEEEKEEEVYPRHHDSVKDGGQAPITQITQIAQMGRGTFKSGNENGCEYYEPRTQVSGSDEPPPSNAHSESHLFTDSISRNGPGDCASGSYSPPPPACNPIHQARPPPRPPP